MKILRTIVLVLIAVGFLIFAVYNWQPVELRLWQNLVLETKVPVLALLAFAAGFLPMWAVHRSVTWSMSRRIRALETSLKTTAMARPREGDAPMAPPVDTSVDKSGRTSGEPRDPFGDGLDGGSGGDGGGD